MTAIRGGAYCSTSPAVGNSSTQIPLNTADTTYPYTAISGNGVLVRGGGAIRITAQGKSSTSITLALKVNGTQVATGSAGTTSSITYVYNAARPGDVLTIWETDGGNIFTDTMTGGAANNFIHYEPYGMAASQPYPAVNRANLF